MATQKVTYEISLKDKFSRALGGVERKTNKFESSLLSLGKIIPAVFAVGAVTSFGKEVFETSIKMEGLKRAIAFSSGSSKEAQKNLSFLDKTVNDLGLDLVSSTDGFKTFIGSTIGTVIQGEKARDIFESVSKASSVMGLSADQTKGTFLALGQILSKGKVQAEELRGQLGERLPGSFQIAARAMNVTTAELDKLLRDGKVVAEDFLPKFAKELEKTFGEGAKNSANSLRANLNRVNNTFTKLKERIGRAVLPSLNTFLQWFLRSVPKIVQVWTAFRTAISEAFRPIAELREVFSDLFPSFSTGLSFVEELTLKIRLMALPFRILANVVKIVGKGIAAIVNIFKGASTETKRVTADFQTLSEKLDAFELQIDLMPSTFKNSLTSMGTFFVEFFNQIKKGFELSANLFKEGFDIQKIVQTGGSNVQNAVKAFADFNPFSDSAQKSRADFAKKQEASIRALLARRKAREDAALQEAKKDPFSNQAFAPSFGINSGGGTSGAGRSSADIKNLSGGVSGKRPGVVNIDIGKLIENFTIKTENLQESALVVQDAIVKSVLTALNDVNVITADG